MAKRNRYYRRVLGKGKYVSNDTRETGLNTNALIIRSAGSSKTGSIVYAQFKSLRDSSLIVVDTKGMLYGMFKTELAKKRFKVKLLDFVNTERSCIYNPLDYVKRMPDGTYRETDIRKISHALIPDELEGKDPFWAISARGVLEFFIAYTLYALPEEDHSMFTVSRLYRIFTAENGEAGFADWIEEHPDSFVAARFAMIKNIQAAEKTTASIYAFVNTALYPFDVTEMHGVFDPASQKEVLDIAEIGMKKTVLFLNISDTDHSMDSLVNLFYTQLLQTLTTAADRNEDCRLKVPGRVIMDDFASGTRIPDFDKIISVVRSRDIWLSICLQSLSQLYSLYGRPEAITIMNNCDHIIYLGGNDLDSAEFIAARAGKTTETVLWMDRTKEYFLEGGKPAELVDKLPAYAYTESDEEMEVAV